MTQKTLQQLDWRYGDLSHAIMVAQSNNTKEMNNSSPDRHVVVQKGNQYDTVIKSLMHDFDYDKQVWPQESSTEA